MKPLTVYSRILMSVILSGFFLVLSGCLSEDEQSTIVEEHLGPGVIFSPFDINAFPLNRVVCDPFGGGGGGTSPRNGVKAQLFYRTDDMPRYYTAKEYIELTQPSGKDLFFDDINVPTRMWDAGFATPTTDVLTDDHGIKLIEYFGLKMNTIIRLGPDDPEGYYEFALLSDDGAVLKIKNPDESWSVLIDNDGDHSTQMGCSSQKIMMKRNTRLEAELIYYQGPRYHIANILMWRPLAEDKQAGKDNQCGKAGNEYFFDPEKNSKPLSPYLGLLNRGWKPLTVENYFIPGSDISYRTNFNPCVNGQDPVISNFRVDEVILTDVWLSWRTDIPATAQVAITNMSTGLTILTSTDNILRTFHQIHLSGLTPMTTYQVRAVSLSDTLGKDITEPIEFTTP